MKKRKVLAPKGLDIYCVLLSKAQRDNSLNYLLVSYTQ